MLSEGREYLATAWWLSVFPGLAIMLLVLGINLLGDGCVMCSTRASACASGVLRTARSD
jgi:ABC-type dipeptide/oligopeptide/nickel transport system permease subunit